MGDRLKVYLETSFVCYLTGSPTSDARVASNQAFTRKWWETERDKCDVFVSEYTLAESQEGALDKVLQRQKVLQGVSMIDVDANSVSLLAQRLLSGHAVPEKEITDALHIAAAAIAGMDVLLTWNCRHMANPHTIPLTRNIVTSAGYVCPAVMTPRSFIDYLYLEAAND